MYILTGYKNPPTSTSSNYNTDNYIMLYVCSVAAIHSSCIMGETRINSSETGLYINYTDLCSIPFIINIDFLFWSCTVAYVPLSDTQQSSSSFNISPPLDWVSVMIGFIQNLIDNKEELKLICILLEAE